MPRPKHTPGPWNVERKYNDILIVSKAVIEPVTAIAKVVDYSDDRKKDPKLIYPDIDERDTNARILAAGPELVESMCELLRSFITGEHYETRNPYGRDYVVKALKLLAKVYGIPEKDYLDATEICKKNDGHNHIKG